MLSYNLATERMPLTGWLTGPKGGVIVGVALHLVTIMIGVFGFAILEGWSLFDSFYMTIISITTVGYGEIHALSQQGRLFTSFIILVGLGSVFFTTTMLGRLILESEFRGTIQRRSMKHRIEGLRGHNIVCGFGRTGRTVAEGLHADGFSFVVIESDKDREDELSSSGYLYLIGDATDEATLKDAGIARARSVMALLSSDADNVYLTIEAKELNPDVKVIARALDEKALTPLKLGGADTVVPTYRIAGHRVLQAAVRPTVTEFFDLASDREQLSLALEEVRIEDGSPLIGRTLESAAIRNRYGVIIVAVKQTSGKMAFNPEAGFVLARGDIVIAIGEDEALRRFGIDCRVPVSG